MTEDEKITFEERKSIVMIDGQMPENYANIAAFRNLIKMKIRCSNYD